MPPDTVAAVPLLLLDLPERTGGPDLAARAAAVSLDPLLAAAARGGVGAAAAPGLGVAVVAHVARCEALAARAAATGLAFLVAGGPVGLLVLALRGTGNDRGQLPPELAAALLADVLGLDGRFGTPIERPDVSPLAVTALADVLGRRVLAEIAGTHPHLVGPVDGMPIDLRYAANRTIALAAGLDELAGPDRQLLYVDPARGHAAVVVGDLLDADHVTVVVPGMGNSIDRFDVVLEKAEALRRAAAGLSPSEDLAAVAWLGYDSPTVDVIVDDEARAGGDQLVRFTDGLTTAGVASTATVSVIGHSYGSVVTGFALQRGLAVDAAAVTGSPGMGTDDADDLGDAPVYALRAPGDFVSWTDHFGTDPTDRSIDITRLQTGDIAGHSSYFSDGSESLTNLALVATGRGGEATVDQDSWLAMGTAWVQRGHELTTDLPIDTSQRVVGAVAGAVSDGTDFVEDLLPDPAAGVVDDVQDVAGAALEVGNRTADFGQRLLSPDLHSDVVEDLWDWATG